MTQVYWLDPIHGEDRFSTITPEPYQTLHCLIKLKVRYCQILTRYDIVLTKSEEIYLRQNHVQLINVVTQKCQGCELQSTD